MSLRIKTIYLICIAIFAFFGSSCGSFTYKGNRFAECCTYLNFFVVSEIDNQGNKLEKQKSLWWIWPNETKNGEYNNLPAFTYGKVPAGWHQTVPEQGEPPSLMEGKTYSAGGNFHSGQDAHFIFTIRNGKAVWLKK